LYIFYSKNLKARYYFESQVHMGEEKEGRMMRIVSIELGCGEVAGAL